MLNVIQNGRFQGCGPHSVAEIAQNISETPPLALSPSPRHTSLITSVGTFSNFEERLYISK